jgi:1,4-alpha-glucan branching enzyme
MTGPKHFYQWEYLNSNRQPKKKISDFSPAFGPVVTRRGKDNKAEKIRFQLLVDNPDQEIYLVGEFNNWGKDDPGLEDFRLRPDSHSIIYSIETEKIRHKDEYMLLVKGSAGPEYRQDPAGLYFTDSGNTVFWDFEDPSCYRPKHGLINTFDRATKILQTDLPSMVVHWRDQKGRLGYEVPRSEFYSFIADSGVLEHIQKQGYNTIQFLPFAQSIDGDNWKYRYLVPYQFAVQKNWGSPDDFARMIDRCHELGIAVIGDFVIAHLPFKDFSIFGKNGDENGIHRWMNRHKTRLFMKEETPWGTMRLDFDNSHVRQFITQSCIHFIKNYRVDGFRVDNVDGILRYGHAGDGDERPNGRTFLRELTQGIYEYNPAALIHFESHFYFNDNAKMLVVPYPEDSRALGATAYNSSRLTYFFHTEYMPKAVDEIHIWKFKDITDEKEWGQSNSTVADFHNHDAAAGLMEKRCTGSYAYDTMTCKTPENHFHAVGKIKVMEALISFMCEGRTLDLMQTFLLQPGTFEHDSSIRWYLAYNQANRNMVKFKSRINRVMDDPAFWPINVGGRKFLGLDNKNKVMVIERRDLNKGTGSRYVIVINLSAWRHLDYKVGVQDSNDYELVFNSDLFDYSGSGIASYPKQFKNYPSKNFELLENEIHLDAIAPYGIIVLKSINKNQG